MDPRLDASDTYMVILEHNIRLGNQKDKAKYVDPPEVMDGAVSRGPATVLNHQTDVYHIADAENYKRE